VVVRVDGFEYSFVTGIVGCAMCEEVVISFQFHFLGSNPNNLGRIGKNVHPKPVDSSLEKGAFGNTEAIRESFFIDIT
jgi:hypothetical protein